MSGLLAANLADPIFADPRTLALGALTGLVFGFLLQKGRVTRFNTIVGQFLLTDFTVLKVMVTAMVVGGAGIYAMLAMGAEFSLHVKAATIAANVIGGVVFGVGMVVYGYCPGTGVAALGDGSRHALPGILGMLAGAAIYAEAYPWFKARVLPMADMGKVSLPEMAGVSPLLLVAALAVGAVVMFVVLEKRARVAG